MTPEHELDILRAADELALAQNEIDALKSRAEKAEACVAEMRLFIENNTYTCDSNGILRCISCQSRQTESHSDDCSLKHALSTSCGTGWLPPEKKARLVEVLQDWVDSAECPIRWPNSLVAFTEHARKHYEAAKEALNSIKEDK